MLNPKVNPLYDGCHQRNVDYFGDLIEKHSNVIDRLKCQELCQSTESCKYWTFHNSFSNGAPNTCYLKQTMSSATYNSSYDHIISGPKYCEGG